MSNPIVSSLQSVGHALDVANAFIAGPRGSTPDIITATSTPTTTTTAGTIVSTTGLTSPTLADYVGTIFEVLDGPCKGQPLLCTAFVAATDTATTTPFWRTPGATTTQFKIWQPPWPVIVVDTATSTTAFNATLRDEADDFWNGHYALGIAGTSAGELREITDFANTSSVFTVDAFTGQPALGDLLIIVTPQSLPEIEMAIDAGVAVERGLMLDTLDKEGVVLGSQGPSVVTLAPEIRGIGTAAGTGVTATAPAELGSQLDAVFAETLDSGDIAVEGGSTTSLVAENVAAQFTVNSLLLINGEAAVVTVAAANTPVGDSTYTLGHTLSADPNTGDVIFAGANYAPADTGHTSSSFVAFQGGSPQRLMLAWGGLPEVTASITGDEIARYGFSYQCQAGMIADRTTAHSDIYGTGTPLVGRGNVNSVRFDGTLLVADVLSAEFAYLSAAQFKGAAFEAFENKGGTFYTERESTVALVMQMEDVSYHQRYRNGDTFDFLLQVGNTATAAWASWAPRTQIIAIEENKDNGLLQWSMTLRFLRSTTAGQPSFVITHF